MTDWYYHAPGQGRVGPLTADEMRRLYRERVIVRDTLAWHEGLREWQPLERLIEELGLTGVQPDMSRPPPPPPTRPSAAGASHAARPNVHVEPPPSNRGGCIIAVIVIGIVGLVMFAILAAIALPAYKDYVDRSKAAEAAKAEQGEGAPSPSGATPGDDGTGEFDAARMQATDALARELVTAAMREFYLANGRTCPDTYEFDVLMVRMPRWQGSRENGWFLLDPAHPDGGLCAYTVRFMGLGPDAARGSVRYEISAEGNGYRVYCRNVDLPAGIAPPRCGA
jgi:hypothetical protein